MGQITVRLGGARLPRVALIGGVVAAAAVVIAATFAGCLQLSGQPCPSGADQCPTGYTCRQGTCEPVGNDGAVAVIHASLPSNIPDNERNNILGTIMETYLDDSMTCRLGRDPADDTWLQNVRPAVSAPIVLDEATEVRVPAGRQVVIIRAESRLGGDVARACFVWDEADPGEWQDFWVRLWRDGRCGDNIIDVGEQCDNGPTGSSRCTDACESVPFDIRTAVDSGGACITEPSVACTWNQSENDGRCIVGWIENGSNLHVTVRRLLGQNDPELERGFEESDASISHLAIAAQDTEAAVIWVDGSGQMRGRQLSWLGQNNNSFDVEGEAGYAIRSLARYVDRHDETVLLAGWVSERGGTIEEVDTNERWHLELPATPSQDLAAYLFSSSVVIGWSVSQFEGDDDSAVIATRVGFGHDESWSTEPILVPDHPEQDQREPAVTGVENGRAFFAWTDINNGLGDDDSGSGIRGRRMGEDVDDESVQVNSTRDGNQHSPVVVTGQGYVVAAWVDDGQQQLRARYVNSHGTPMERSFGQGGRADFPIVAGSTYAGPPAIATLDSVYFLWVEQPGGCGQGGTVLRMLIMPPPLP